jgi:PAS domain S-box-containing protein
MYKESEVLEKFLKNVPAQIVLLNEIGQYQYISGDAVTNQELRNWIIGKTDFEYCIEKNKPIEIAEKRDFYFKKALETRSKTSFNEVIINNGISFKFERIYMPVYNTDNNLEYVIGYGFDNTEAKDNEVALQIFKEAIENSSDGIAFCDTEGKYYYMNKVHASIFDYKKPEELYGLGWEILYDNEEIERLKNEVFPILGKEKVWHGETIGKTKTGRIVHQYISLTILPNAHLLCITRDISESIKTLILQRKFTKAIELSGTCIIMLDKNGELEWGNKYFYEITQLNIEDICRYKLLTFQKTENQNTKRGIIHLLEHDGFSSAHIGKAILTTANGLEISMLISLNTIFDDHGKLNGYVIVQMDISSMEATQMQIINSLKSISEINEFKTQLISVVSHELRTPIAAIQIYSDIMKQQFHNDKISDKYNRYIDILNDQIETIGSALDSFLTLGKLNTNNFTVNKQPEKPVELISNYLQSSKLLANKTRTITFDYNQSNTYPLDSTVFLIIFKNLIENAHKYSSPTKPIHINLTGSETEFSVSVQDFGIGIPENEQHKIFSQFFRASNTGTISGYGLGLHIINSLAKLHNAQIFLNSKINVGSTFTIKF